jgi:anti-sigma B factor antagonist
VTGWAETDSPNLIVVGLWIVVSQQDTTTTIALDGEWDLAQREKISYAVANALACQPHRVVLDLTRLTFMDSTGVHGVLDLARRAAELNVDLVMIPGPPAVQRLFELCQLPESVTWVEAA